MAEQATEKIVFEINVDSYLEQLRQVNIQINQAKQNQKELKELAEKGDKEAAINLQNVNVFLKVQQQEYSSLQKTLVGFTAAEKNQADTVNFLNNSIKTNRALLSQLTEQYNSLKNPGKELTDTIKNLSDTLKKQESAIGDTRRNVGNYTESILDAVGGLKIFGKDLGSVINPLKNFGSGLAGISAGAEGLTAALLATGLPLLIAGISAVSESLKVYQSIADKATEITSGLSEAIKFAIPLFIKYGAAAEGFTVGITQAYLAGVQFAQIQKQIEIQQIANIKQQSEEEITIQKLLLASRDRTKSEKDRVAFLDEAILKERDKIDAEKKIVDQEIILNKQRQALNLAITGEENRDLLRAGAELEKNRNDLEVQSIEFEEGRQRRRNALIKEGIIRDLKLFEDNSKLLISSGQATANNLIAIEQARLKRELEDNSLFEDEKQNLIRQSAIKQIQIRQEFDNRAANARIKSLELQAAEDVKVGKDVTAQLVAIEDEKSKVFLNNILLNDAEKDNIRREAKDKELQIEIDGNNKIIDEIVKSQELDVQLLAQNGITDIKLLVAIEEEKSDKVLAVLQKGSRAYENEMERRGIAVNAIIEKDALTAAQQQVKLDDLAFQVRKEDFEQRIRLGELFGDKQIEELRSITAREIDLEKEKNAAIQEDNTKSLKDREIAQKESDLRIIKIKNASEKQIISISENSSKAQIQAFNQIAGATIQGISDVGEALSAGAEFQRAIALFQILLQEGVAIANAIVGALATGFGTPTFIGPFVAAVIGAFAGIAKFVAPVPKATKLADGGGIDIDGRPHSQGGTPIHVNGKLVAEAEEGEKMFILKKTASKQIGALSALNQMFGGRSFDGAPVTHAADGGRIANVNISDGGFFQRSIQSQFDLRQLESTLINALKNSPAPVVSVKEITRVTNGLNRSTRVSEAG